MVFHSPFAAGSLELRKTPEKGPERIGLSSMSQVDVHSTNLKTTLGKLTTLNPYVLDAYEKYLASEILITFCAYQTLCDHPFYAKYAIFKPINNSCGIA